MSFKRILDDEKYRWKDICEFLEDVPILFISKGDKFEVKSNVDGYEFISIGKFVLYLTPKRDLLKIYKIIRK